MLPSEIGERTEAAVLAALVGAGKRVLKPFGSHDRYDLAFEEDGRLIRVQCKSGTIRKGALTFRPCSLGRGPARDYRDQVDLFGVYCHERSEVYMVPVGEVPLRLAHLRLEPARNGQKSGIRSAEHFLLWKDGKVVDPRPHAQRPAYIDKHRYMRDRSEMATSQMELPVLCCAPLSAASITDQEAQATADLFKALADPHRVKIINLLATVGEAVCVCDINIQVELSQPTISFHLKKLASVGLLNREQRGTWAYYSLDATAMKKLGTVVQMKKGTR